MSRDNSKTPTHIAFAASRRSKGPPRLLECGTGRIEQAGNLVHVFMDRTPLAYTGYILLSPIGAQPPKIEAQRADENGEETEG